MIVFSLSLSLSLSLVFWFLMSYLSETKWSFDGHFTGFGFMPFGAKLKVKIFFRQVKN
jgi:hypothetical protein